MTLSLTFSGIAITTLAWVLLLANVHRGRKNIGATFLLTYGIGTALVITDLANAGFTNTAWLYVITLLTVALVYIKVHK